MVHHHHQSLPFTYKHECECIVDIHIVFVCEVGMSTDLVRSKVQVTQGFW